ncbi:MAG: hypothetical protein WCC59_00620 [Terriglobales bacterium]
MATTAFALFVDVMGVQRELLPAATAAEARARFQACRERLEHFRRDLASTIVALDTFLMPAAVPPPTFIAEFSDSAYIIGPKFASVAIPAIWLMRRALRHEYPLRGGIGFGTFLHEASGARFFGTGQVWSTSSFLGGAVVTSYLAERSTAMGLRVFVHRDAMQQAQELFLESYSTDLLSDEVDAVSTHELRLFDSNESAAAVARMRRFRESQNLTARASGHYESTIAAYERFGTISAGLPHTLPALWLDR